MPPANSRTDTRASTRASTPPPYSTRDEIDHSLTPDHYLQQLEEAISTPVPNFAATLNLSSSAEQSPDITVPRDRTSIISRTEDAWDGRTVLHLSRDGEGDDSEHDRPNSSRRSLYLTESEFRSRSRDNLNEEVMQGRRGTLRGNLESPDTTQVTGQYATSGIGPRRQTLYDWAAGRSRSRSRSRRYILDDDNAEDNEQTRDSNILPSQDSNARRDLDRALRNYRLARSALRSNRTSGNDIGSVPTASALLAYWNEEPNDNPNPPTRSVFPFQEFIEQHRRTRQMRNLQQSQVPTESENQVRGNQSNPRPTKIRKSSDSFMRVRNTIKYLSALRNTGVHGGMTLSKMLGLDSLYASEEMNMPNDLPMTIESLPVPQQSSWLQPGMVWQGLQSTDREQPSTSPSIDHLRRERHREVMRRAMLRRGLNNESMTSASTLAGSTSALLDAERYLSDLLQDSNGRWSFGQPETDSLRPSGLDTVLPSYHNSFSESYHWPVKVTLHSVDFDNMTVSGTMSASQIPDKLAPSPSANDQKQEGKSMESYFEGEIIDFRQHTLETEGRGYKVGGIDVDARYWARLGPFRREIDKANAGSSSQSNFGMAKFFFEKEDPISEASRDAKVDEVMAMCLGSQKWIDEKLGKEWVLMRWKERCFITPVPSSENYAEASSSTSNTSRIYTTGPTSTSNSPNSTTWGLTIIGFYYIALHRQTGEIDGLYYDPGSQPYQQLKMVPDMTLQPPHDTQPKVFSSLPPNNLGNKATQIGVRSWFPSVEFR